MSEWIHLAYVSAATGQVDIAEIEDIIEASKRNNPPLDITGMLLYSDGSFLQVLEGERSAVNALFMDISGDPRHTRISKLFEEAIDRRYFKDWSMGLARMTSRELEAIPGCFDYFRNGGKLSGLDDEKARKVLDGFKHGKWHQKLL